MPVVYNRADSGKSQKPDKAPKQPKQQKSGGSKAADIDADEKKKLIILGVGTLVAAVFLYWVIFMRGGDTPPEVGSPGTSAGKTGGAAAGGDGTGKLGKKNGMSLGDDPASDGGAGGGAKPPKSDGGM